MPELPDETKLIELGEKLLSRTHDYCEDAYLQQDIIKKQIDKIVSRLDKSIDANEIIKLSTAIKTLQEVLTSLHDKSVIGFMAHYKPLKALMDSVKSSSPIEVTVDIDDSCIDSTTIEPDFDINGIYRKYED